MQLFVAEFEVLFLHFLEGLRKKSQKKSKYRWSVDQYLYIGPVNHEAQVLFSSGTGIVITRTL
jgi:hypothetical protein